jgi:hypothetical protein
MGQMRTGTVVLLPVVCVPDSPPRAGLCRHFSSSIFHFISSGRHPSAPAHTHSIRGCATLRTFVPLSLALVPPTAFPPFLREACFSSLTVLSFQQRVGPHNHSARLWQAMSRSLFLTAPLSHTVTMRPSALQKGMGVHRLWLRLPILSPSYHNLISHTSCTAPAPIATSRPSCASVFGCS